jgi:capsular exopolysaccharide synthesis family protein
LTERGHRQPVDTGERPIRREQELSAVIWRGRYLILVAVLAAVLVAEFVNLTSKKVYEATAVLQARSEQVQQAPTDPLTLQQASQGAASTYARLLGDRTVLEELAPKVFGGRLSVDDLQSRTNAKAVQDTSLIQLTATGSSADEARRLASQVATGFIGLTQASSSGRSLQVQKQLQQRITQISAQIQRLVKKNPGAAEQLTSLRAARTALNNRLANEVASGIEQSSRVGLVAPPAAGNSPVRPRTMLNLLGAILLGFIIGIGLALLRARLDTVVRSSHEVGEVLRTPILASIPLVSRPESSAPVAESFEVARMNIEFLAADEPIQVITVTSHTAGEGKSSSTAFLARAEARSGKRVLLIDGDMRTSQLSQRFGLGSQSGLSLLLSQAAPERTLYVELEPNLFFLPAGAPPPDPVQLLASSRMRRVLKELRDEFDLVLIDSPPVAHLADAPILTSLADGILVVARAGFTKQSDLTELAAQLRNIPCRLLGAIVIEHRSLSHDYPLAKVKPIPDTGASRRNGREARPRVGADQ